MTTYSVYYSEGMNQAVIALEGYQPTNGAVEVGSFELDVDPVNSQTSASELATGGNGHPFVTKAMDVMKDAGFTGDLSRVTFLDKASNASLHPETGTHTDDLETSEEGSHPNFSNQKGGVGSTEGTDPTKTDANGQSEKQERQDTGETKDTSDQPQGNANAQKPDPNNGGLPKEDSDKK